LIGIPGHRLSAASSVAYFAIAAVGAGSAVYRWRRCNAAEQRTSNTQGPACRQTGHVGSTPFPCR
jgi:hypothetical protein